MIAQPKRTILVIEDSDEDFETIERVILASGRAWPIRATNGENGVRLLRSQEPGHDVDLILLYLNMSGLDGRDVLREIKTDEKLRLIPAVVFTTSPDPRDIQCCYRNGANSYHLKPIDLYEFQAVVQSIIDYWIDKNISYQNGVDR
ncbi:MAG: response regulator [Schlesneria sp.]